MVAAVVTSDAESGSAFSDHPNPSEIDPAGHVSAQLADELEVTRRTVYRDIADLAGQRVPKEKRGSATSRSTIRDAAADADAEIKAVLLGAQIEAKLVDVALNIASVVPKDLHLSQTEVEGITNLGGWLTTVTARICLDMLRD